MCKFMVCELHLKAIFRKGMDIIFCTYDTNKINPLVLKLNVRCHYYYLKTKNDCLVLNRGNKGTKITK